MIAAGGCSSRMGGTDKLRADIYGMPALGRSAGAFAGIADDIVVAASDPAACRALLDSCGLYAVKTVQGGATRMLSVLAGMRALPGADYIAVHDGARPFARREDILSAYSAARECGAAFLCTPQRETVHSVENGLCSGTPERGKLVCAKTPQIFRADILKKAFELAMAQGCEATDEAELVCRAGFECRAVQGSEDNVKLTLPSDLDRLRLPRVGHGYDVHRLVPGRKLILGGVEIPFSKGLEGHSDADVLLHAVTDALLGAACMGDIGRMFPDTDERYRGISSMILLERANQAAGVRVMNVDATIIAQAPKLAAYIDAMRDNIKSVLGAPYVNVKATTEEGLGYTGRGEGIAAHAVCTII